MSIPSQGLQILPERKAAQNADTLKIEYLQLSFALGDAVRVHMSRAGSDNWARWLEFQDGPDQQKLLASNPRLRELKSDIAPTKERAISDTQAEVRALLGRLVPRLQTAHWQSVFEQVNTVDTSVVHRQMHTAQIGTLHIASDQPLLRDPTKSVFTVVIENNGNWYRYCGFHLRRELMRESVLIGDTVRIECLGYSPINSTSVEKRSFNRFNVQNLSYRTGETCAH